MRVNGDDDLFEVLTSGDRGWAPAEALTVPLKSARPRQIVQRRLEFSGST